MRRKARQAEPDFFGAGEADPGHDRAVSHLQLSAHQRAAPFHRRRRGAFGAGIRPANPCAAFALERCQGTDWVRRPAPGRPATCLAAVSRSGSWGGR
jgi:hypothetical protein